MKQKIPSGYFCSPGIHYILFSLKVHQHYLTKNLFSVIIFLFWLVTAIKNQTTVYYFKYVFHDQNLVARANIFTFSSLIGVLLIIRIANRYGNKRTMMSGMWIALCGQIILTAGSLLHSLPLLYAAITINCIGQGMIVGLISIMIADLIRYGITLGVQAEGVFSSASDFGVNLGLGIGGLITAGLFDLSGYRANHLQNAETLRMIHWNYTWIPLAIYLLMITLFHFYDERLVKGKK